MESLELLASNLWWSWSPKATALFQQVDPLRYSSSNHNPKAMLVDLEPTRLTELAKDEHFCRLIEECVAEQKAYLTGAGWFQDSTDVTASGHVLYLSMEFGLHESLPIYSGGLGVLAGDHLRSASDLNLPLTGVGLLYRSGYFHQLIFDRSQVAAYPNADFDRLPVERLQSDDGKDLTVDIPIGDIDITALVYRVKVGRLNLMLLSTDCEQNPDSFRDLTDQLYGGGREKRLQQEILLGIGAVKVGQLLGLEDPIYHLNEGHCAFTIIELMRQRMMSTGCGADKALSWVRNRTVFTTHTPVPAGHDRFAFSLIDNNLGRYRSEMTLAEGALTELGRVNKADLDEPLCMTVLALRGATYSNGVSRLHGAVSREMWQQMWPNRSVDQVPISHITNGVHPTFWMSALTQSLFSEVIPEWRSQLLNDEWWHEAIDSIPADKLWLLRCRNRHTLLASVQLKTGRALDPDALTIGFARRFATYKRANLIFSDIDRITSILNRGGGQLVFAGKAHPKDIPGQAIISEVLKMSQSTALRDRVAFIPNYDISVGRALTSGSDVWLNNPRRPMEASGTSGQKVPLNGGINMSILDGWWDEGATADNGWSISGRDDYPTDAENDDDAVQSLYTLLEDEVFAEFNDRGPDGLPHRFIARMRASMATCIPKYNSHRMVADYTLNAYQPLLLGLDQARDTLTT